jgi:hypothetical protein
MDETEITRQLTIFEELAKHRATREDTALLKVDIQKLRAELIFWIGPTRPDPHGPPARRGARAALPTAYQRFMRHFLSCRLRQFLELHLGSESDNDGVPRPSAHSGVILHD